MKWTREKASARFLSDLKLHDVVAGTADYWYLYGICRGRSGYVLNHPFVNKLIARRTLEDYVKGWKDGKGEYLDGNY